MERNEVVLVDIEDRPLGVMDKLEAHEKGVLHRAFSVFIFNSKGEMLIHQRSTQKYHSPGLWTNACCSHPQWNENLKQGALERLQFEMGLSTDINKLFSFIYIAPMENGLIEHEFDHVFVGYTDQTPTIDPTEVQDYRWIATTDLLDEMNTTPERFTFWFREVANDVIKKVEAERRKVA